MTITSPLDIDLFAFIKTGKFDYIKLGQTKEWIIHNFPNPDDMYLDNYNSPIWFYGNIEFHFHDDDKLFLIYSDYIDTLDGGQSLRLQKWIFDQPEQLTVQTVIRNLNELRVGFTLEYRIQSDHNISVQITIIESGVTLSFALLEDDEEGYSDYLIRCKNSDVNLFRLYSISLMAK